MKENNTIGARIREQRKKAGLTQEQLGAKLLMNKQTISEYENDHIDIKCSVIKEIARALGVSAGYLVEGEIEYSNIEGNEMLYIQKLLEDKGLLHIAIKQIK